VVAPSAPPIIRAAAVLEPAPHEEEIELPQTREEMERLKIMLSLAASRSELKTVMFVSALAGEGVSTVSLGLATELAAGAMQGVLLIESSSGHAGLGEWLQLSPRYGLSDMLAKAIQRNEAVLATGVPRLFYLGRGRVDADFSQPRWTGLFEELIADLRDAFDYVVLDGGSLETSPDSLLLARRVDGVVLVIESETSASLVREATMNLRKAGANLLGVVLNRRRHYLPKFLAKRM
jgi:Mrp family chromosome partitioning ATPase